jgi:hypothetical protein
MLVSPEDPSRGMCGTSGNLHSSELIKLLVAQNGSQYKKKGNFCTEKNQEVNTQPFSKRLQVVYLVLSSAGDRPNSLSMWVNVVMESYFPVKWQVVAPQPVTILSYFN